MDINTDQRVRVTLAIVDAQGRPASVDGIPVWATADATIVTVVPDINGMAAWIDTVAPGTGRATVTADADLGAGVVTLTGVTEDIVVTLGPSHQASAMTLTLGVPEARP